MAKNVIKEIIIILLLALAIILILGVLLYRYTAYNKVLPEEVSYQTSEEVKQEIESSNTIGDEQPVLRYSVTASELQSYERNNEYVEGKRNPFAESDTQAQSGTSGNTSGSGQTTGGTSSSGGTTSSGSETNTNDDRFFTNKGTK